MTDELQLLLEERAILRTMYRYCHAMDDGAEQEWLETFTDDAVFDVFKWSGETVHRPSTAKMGMRTWRVTSQTIRGRRPYGASTSCSHR